MADPRPIPTAEPNRGFPFVTVVSSLVVFFVFVGLMILAYRKPDVLNEPRPAEESEPKLDAAEKSRLVRERNEAILAGLGARMSVPEATDRLLRKLKKPTDTLPFPVPQPPQKEQKS